MCLYAKSIREEILSRKYVRIMEPHVINEYKEVQHLISELSFDECIKVYELLELQHPIVDFLFERMNELDSVRFDEWL